jgi:hypothetical protein
MDSHRGQGITFAATLSRTLLPLPGDDEPLLPSPAAGEAGEATIPLACSSPFKLSPMLVLSGFIIKDCIEATTEFTAESS